MKYKVETKNFTILRNKPIPKTYVERSKKAYQKNQRFFGKTISKYKITKIVAPSLYKKPLVF